MTGSRVRTLACMAIVVTLGTAGCATTPGGGYGYPAPAASSHPVPGQPLGTLTDIRGPNAYYQRGGAGPATRAYEGLAVYAGDRIYTGPDTRMIMRFMQGGHAELDESTDPVPRFLSDLGCLIIDLLRTGRMFVDGTAVCVGAVGTIARQNSQVMYDVRRGYAEITVAGGRAQLRRPDRVEIPAGWRTDANARTVLVRPYPLTRRQVEDAVRWTRWYQQRRPALPGITEGGAPSPPVTRVPRPPTAPTSTTAPPASTPPPPVRVLPPSQRALPQTKPADGLR